MYKAKKEEEEKGKRKGKRRRGKGEEEKTKDEEEEGRKWNRCQVSWSIQWKREGLEEGTGFLPNKHK